MPPHNHQGYYIKEKVLEKGELLISTQHNFRTLSLRIILVGGQFYLWELLEVLSSLCLVLYVLDLPVDDSCIVDWVCSSDSVAKLLVELSHQFTSFFLCLLYDFASVGFEKIKGLLTVLILALNDLSFTMLTWDSSLL